MCGTECHNILVSFQVLLLDFIGKTRFFFAPFYRYWNGHDHFYTTNINEIGTAKAGQRGRYGYHSEGTQCTILKRQVHGSVPLYRYFNGREHFYTTNANEIGTTTAGVLGKHGYRSEGVAGYCYPTQAHYTIPLYRYWNPSIGDHFYTTNCLEIGFHHHSWHYEGIQCYVIPK